MEINYKESLKALLESLECENIENFIENATEKNCRRLGESYTQLVKYRISLVESRTTPAKYIPMLKQDNPM